MPDPHPDPCALAFRAAVAEALALPPDHPRVIQIARSVRGVAEQAALLLSLHPYGTVRAEFRGGAFTRATVEIWPPEDRRP